MVRLGSRALVLLTLVLMGAVGHLARADNIGSLIEKLGSESYTARRDAQAALVKIGKPAVQPLVDALMENHPGSTSWADNAMKAAYRQQLASEALVRIGAAVPALIPHMYKASPRYLGAAGSVLARIGSPAVGPLLETLKNGEPQAKSDAACVLGYIHDPRVVPTLLDLLREENAEDDIFRQTNGYWASYSLGEAGKPAVPQLIAALGDQNPKVQMAAVNVLARLRDRRAVPALLALFKTSEGQMKDDVGDALGRIGDERAFRPLLDAASTNRAMEGLRNMSEYRFLPLWIKCLDDPRPRIRQAAVSMVTRFKGCKELPRLRGRLYDKDRGVRYDAAVSLGRRGDPEAFEPLISMIKELRHPSSDDVALALACYGSKGVDTLLKVLKESEWLGTRVAAATALGSLLDRHKYPRVDGKVPPALLPKQEKKIIAALAEALGDKDSYLTSKVMLGLSKARDLDDTSVTALMGNADSWFAGLPWLYGNVPQWENERLARFFKDRLRGDNPSLAITGLARMNSPLAEDALIGILDDLKIGTNLKWQDSKANGSTVVVSPEEQNRRIRCQAALSLRKSKNPRVIDALIRLSKSDDADIRGSAFSSLSCIDDARAIKATLEFLWGDHNDYQHDIVYNLGKHRSEEAINQYRALIVSPDPQVRRYAAELLGNAGSAEDTSRLSVLLKDAVASVRLHAALALDGVGDTRAVEPLIVALKDEDFEVRYAAVRALGKFRSAVAVPWLIKVLQSDDPALVSAAVEGLAQIRDKRAVAPLISMLSIRDGLYDSPNEIGKIRAAVIRALGKCRDRSVIPLIKPLLNDINPRVQTAAACTLAEFGMTDGVDLLLAELGPSYGSPMTDGPPARDIAAAISGLDDPIVAEFWTSALKWRNYWLVAAGHRYFIRKGIDEAIPILVEMWGSLTDADVAADYIASNRPELVAAGRKWVADHPQARLLHRSAKDAVRWGCDCKK